MFCSEGSEISRDGIPGNIQGHDGWGSEQPGVVEMSISMAGGRH